MLSSCTALPPVFSVPVGASEGNATVGVGKLDTGANVSDVEVQGDLRVQSIPFSTLAFGVLGWTIAGGVIGYSMRK